MRASIIALTPGIILIDLSTRNIRNVLRILTLLLFPGRYENKSMITMNKSNLFIVEISATVFRVEAHRNDF